VLSIRTGFRWGVLAMAQTRRYTIEVKDAASKAVVVAAALDWTTDERDIAVTQIFRLPGLAGGKGLIHRLSHLHAAAGNETVAHAFSEGQGNVTVKTCFPAPCAAAEKASHRPIARQSHRAKRSRSKTKVMP